MSETSHYRWIALASAAGLAALSGYVLYQYAFADEDEALPAAPSASQSAAAKSTVPKRETPKRPAPPTATPTAPSKPTDPATDSKKPLPFNPLGKPASSSAGSGGTKSCAHCKKVFSGTATRCSQCKSTYYCSRECQKKAWSDHKGVCGKDQPAGRSDGAGPSAHPVFISGDLDRLQSQASAVLPTPASAAEAATAAPATDSSATSPSDAAPAASEDASSSLAGWLPTTPADSAESTSAAAAANDANGDDTAVADAAKPLSMQEAMAQYLQQAAKERAGTLDGAFEECIMHFLQGDHRTALAKFAKVQTDAKAQGRSDLEGEMHRWIGHCYSRMGDAEAAATAFEAGCTYGRANKLPKLNVECMTALGSLYRSQGQLKKAVETLSHALQAAEEGNDEEGRASVLSNLGSAMLPEQPDEGLMCMQLAVKLREDAVERVHDAGDRSGLATAVMEHASALVGLAGALYATRRLEQAKAAYEQALDVFELVEDTEKTAKCLVNLHNMAEMQMEDAELALQYRTKLLAYLRHHQMQPQADTCTVCHEPLHPDKRSDKASRLLILPCLHCHHDACFLKANEGKEAGQAPACPMCKQPVPLFD